jgi:hypothetical protein
MEARTRTAAVVALMAIGCLALWLAVPAAWLWLTRDLDSGPRFLIALPGCALNMAAVGWLLFRLEEVYFRLSGAAPPEEEPPSWMRRNRDAAKPRRALTLLERLMVGSAVVALLTLVIWWAFLADSPNPSGPLQPL